MLSPRALQMLPYKFEMKCAEQVSVWQAIAQVTARAVRNTSRLTPCIVLGKNRTKPVAVVPLSHWCELLRAHSPPPNGTHLSSLPPTATYRDFVELLSPTPSAPSPAPTLSATTVPTPTANTATAMEAAVVGDSAQPQFYWGATSGEDASARKALAWVTARAWHGEHVEATPSGLVLEDPVLGSWRVRFWSSPRFNVWRVYPEVVKECKRENDARVRALAKINAAREGQRRIDEEAILEVGNSGPLSQPGEAGPSTHPRPEHQVQIPLVVFGRADEGHEGQALFACFPFDLFLRLANRKFETERRNRTARALSVSSTA